MLFAMAPKSAKFQPTAVAAPPKGASIQDIARYVLAVARQLGRRPPRSTGPGKLLYNTLRRKPADTDEEAAMQSLRDVANLRQCKPSTVKKIKQVKDKLLDGKRLGFSTQLGRFVTNQKFQGRSLKRPAAKRPAGRRQMQKKPSGLIQISQQKKPSGLIQTFTYSTDIFSTPAMYVATPSAQPSRDYSNEAPRRVEGIPLMTPVVCDLLLHMLKTFSAFMCLRYPAVPWIVDFGTLLAQARHQGKGLIAHDYDIDVGVIVEASGAKDFFVDALLPMLVKDLGAVGYGVRCVLSPTGLPAAKVRDTYM